MQSRLRDNFDVIEARTTSLRGPNKTASNTNQYVVDLPWTLGTSWAPEESHEYTLDPDNEWYDEVLEADVGDVMANVLLPTKQRVRSQTSVRFDCTLLFACSESWIHRLGPMCIGKRMPRSLYLDELMRHDGRGDFLRNAQCPDCVTRGVEKPERVQFRCRDCFLPDLTCRMCFIRRHKLNPFHCIEVSAIIYVVQVIP